MIVEALPFQTHLAVSRIDSRRSASTPAEQPNPFDSEKIEISFAVEHTSHGNNTIRDDVVRRIRGEVEAGTYLNREKINAAADRLHRTLRA